MAKVNSNLQHFNPNRSFQTSTSMSFQWHLKLSHSIFGVSDTHLSYSLKPHNEDGEEKQNVRESYIRVKIEKKHGFWLFRGERQWLTWVLTEKE